MFARSLLALLIFLYTLAVYAGDQPNIDCSGAPNDAVVSIPSPVDKWLALVCSRYGHALVAHESTNWVHMLSNTFGGLFPAQRPQGAEKPKVSPHGYYFTSLVAAELNHSTAATEERDLLAADRTVWRFDAITNIGGPMRFYFVRFLGDDTLLSFVSCGRRCGGDYLIALTPEGKK